MKPFIDPTWWVGVVFIGVVVGIISGFLKDYISKILSRFSSRYKSWRQKRNAAFNRHAKSIAKEFGLIIYAKLQCILFFLMWCVMAIVMLFGDVISKITGGYSFFSSMAMILFGASSLIPYYKGLYFLRLSAKARQIYLKNKFSGAKKKAAGKKRG